MEDETIITEPTEGSQPSEAISPAPGKPTSTDDVKAQRQIAIIAVAIGVPLLILLILGIYFLLQPTTDTAKIRDVFIILLALESMIIGVSLVIMLIQLAKLMNLMQNEVKPILESTEETLNTLRGTTAFLSENAVEPVMKINEYLAGLRSLTGAVRLGRRR